jgi:hypothetical protein
MIPGYFGLPTIDGKQALGASSPAIPALHIPDPLSITIAAVYSSAIFFLKKYFYLFIKFFKFFL